MLPIPLHLANLAREYVLPGDELADSGEGHEEE
jgi:hypothetical protein